MQRAPNKFFVSLLAVLLAVAPLQDPVAASSAGKAYPTMAMADSERMVVMSEMAETSSSCDNADDCHSEGCAFGHCATCIADVFTPTANTAATTLGAFLPQLSIQFFSKNFPSHFRPPRA